MGLAQNEMKAKPALPERVRSMEGLGVIRMGCDSLGNLLKKPLLRFDDECLPNRGSETSA